MVILGILLLSCVVVEPAPSDLVLAMAIPLGLFTGGYRPKIRGDALVGLLMLMAYCLVSLPGIADAADQAYALRYYFITFYLFLLAVFVSTYARSDTIKSLLRAYVFAALISFFAGLLGYLGFFSDLLMADPFRVKGLFKDPNVFGPFFVPAILLLLEDSRNRVIWKTPVILHWFAIAMMSTGVLFSFSRAAWLNLIASVAIYVTLNLRRFRLRQILRLAGAFLLIGVLLVAVLLSPWMANTGLGDFLQERSHLQKYDSERFNAHHGGWELVKKNPFGYGPGQFAYEIADETHFRIDAHSLYVRTAMEDGILGFLLFFGSLAYLILMLFARQMELGLGQRISQTSPAVVLATLGGILVNSMVVDTIHWRHFWFFIGIGLFCMQEMRKETP